VVKESTKYCQVSDKSKLRRLLINQRLAMSSELVSFKSTNLAKFFLETISEDDSLFSIALYYPIKSEVETEEIHEGLLGLNKTLFYPKIIDNRIQFVEPKDCKDFSKGTLNVMEPRANNFIDYSEIDLFVVPSVAVGSSGVRLGYGGGFYDKALSFIDKKKICSIIYDFQFVHHFDGEKHDIQVSKVFTDKGPLHIN
jgi:5-formyltetrahydrofolate cyclo-ligase